jgi:hypothetical protein
VAAPGARWWVGARAVAAPRARPARRTAPKAALPPWVSGAARARLVTLDKREWAAPRLEARADQPAARAGTRSAATPAPSTPMQAPIAATPAPPRVTRARLEHRPPPGCAAARAAPVIPAPAAAPAMATSFSHAASIAKKTPRAGSAVPGAFARGSVKAWPATSRAWAAAHSAARARAATSIVTQVAARPIATPAPTARRLAPAAVVPRLALEKEPSAASTGAKVAAAWSVPTARLVTFQCVAAAARWNATDRFAPSTNAGWAAPSIATGAVPASLGRAPMAAATCNGSRRQPATKAPPWSFRTVPEVPATSTVERSIRVR